MGVALGVGVGVALGAGVGVAVGAGVGVAVETGVAVAIGRGVEVGDGVTAHAIKNILSPIRIPNIPVLVGFAIKSIIAKGLPLE